MASKFTDLPIAEQVAAITPILIEKYGSVAAAAIALQSATQQIAQIKGSSTYFPAIPLDSRLASNDKITLKDLLPAGYSDTKISFTTYTNVVNGLIPVINILQTNPQKAVTTAQTKYTTAVTSLASSQQALLLANQQLQSAKATYQLALDRSTGSVRSAGLSAISKVDSATVAVIKAENAVLTAQTAVKTTQLELNTATNNLQKSTGSAGPAVSPAIDPGAKQAIPYNVQTATGTGPTMSSSNGLLNIAGATALAIAAANPQGTANVIGSIFSSAGDILGITATKNISGVALTNNSLGIADEFTGIDAQIAARAPSTNILGSLFSFSGKTTKPSVTKTGTTTGTTTPVDTSDTAQDAAKLLVQAPALTDDEDQNLQNIVGAQGEIVRAEDNIQSNNRQILANEEAQAAAQEQQRQAQAIIDENNAELADDNLPDSRRAELEANNAAQRASIAENAAVIDEAQTNIDNATANNEQQTDSILTNQGVIGENSEAFTANGSELGAPVVADNDPQTAVDQNFLDANAEVQAETTLTILSEEETNALFDGAEPGLVSNFVDANEPVGPGDNDPFEQARFEAELAAEVPANEIVLTADEQAAADDPFEARRLELEQEANRQELAEQATDVEPTDDPFEQRRLELEREADEQEANRAAGDNVDTTTDQGLPQDDGTTQGIQDQINDQDAADTAAARDNAKNQATLQARYKQPASADWRVRLQLAPGANYLYKAGKDGGEAGILKPLYDTDGVIFPYTPSIETSYNANYEMYDLTHSNFRGYFYKNSRVNDINIRATFTAQDTQEAAYLLAVIHFFRSVTKMFYGAKDAYRGAPPPLTYLSGLGAYQFNNHPCVVSQFNYSLPPDVDYIRADAPNNYGTNLLTQRARTGAIAPTLGSASLTRLLGTLTKPDVGAMPRVPTPGMINQNVNNTSQATYVPTKIELSITLLPINTRSQVSTQFNMKEFASGALIKGGFW
jgi:hypothetical protein